MVERRDVSNIGSRPDRFAQTIMMKGKMSMRQNILLEEAIAGADFPVYGLPETADVCDLHYSGDPYAPTKRGAVTLTYQSRLYLPFLHEKTHGSTFLLHSCMLESEPGDMQAKLVIRDWSPRDIPGVPPAVRLGITMFIEGKSFKGYIVYTPKPIYYSEFSLNRGRINLEGQSLGPSIDDLIQIFSSLRVLNGKAVE
jgi:hypothetical protein